MNIKTMEKLIFAIYNASEALLEEIAGKGPKSKDSEASVTTGKSRAEKRTKSKRATSSETDSDEWTRINVAQRTRLRDFMASTGKCVLLNPDTGKTVLAGIDEWQGEPRGRISMRALSSIFPKNGGPEIGDTLLVRKVGKGKFEVKLESNGTVNVNSLFDEDEEETPKKGQKTESTEKKSASVVSTYCPNCEKETKHKQIAGKSKKGRTVYRVTCKVCDDEHAKGTEGQHKQWANFKAEHTDAPKSKGTSYVKSEVSDKQKQREAKREKRANNNRKGRANMSNAARSAMGQADILRGI